MTALRELRLRPARRSGGRRGINGTSPASPHAHRDLPGAIATDCPTRDRRSGCPLAALAGGVEWVSAGGAPPNSASYLIRRGVGVRCSIRSGCPFFEQVDFNKSLRNDLSMPYEALTRQRLERALRRLGELAEQQGIVLELSLYGGAVFTLVYGSRDSTKDVDAIVLPSAPAKPLLAQIAREQDLPDDWLNSQVAQFLSPVGTKVKSRPRSLSEVAAAADSLGAFGHHLRDWQHHLSSLTSRPAVWAAIESEPVLLAGRFEQGEVADAWLAATAEYLAARIGLAAPEWVAGEGRRLLSPWFTSPVRRLAAMRDSPAPFKNRNLFTESVDLPLHLRPGRPRVSPEQLRAKNAERQRRFRARRTAAWRRLAQSAT